MEKYTPQECILKINNNEIEGFKASSYIKYIPCSENKQTKGGIYAPYIHTPGNTLTFELEDNSTSKLILLNLEKNSNMQMTEVEMIYTDINKIPKKLSSFNDIHSQHNGGSWIVKNLR